MVRLGLSIASRNSSLPEANIVKDMSRTTILLVHCVQYYLGAPQGPRFSFARECHDQGIRLLCLGITRN